MTDGGPVTNVVTVISSEWLAWLRLRGVGAKNFQAVSLDSTEGKPERNFGQQGRHHSNREGGRSGVP